MTLRNGVLLGILSLALASCAPARNDPWTIQTLGTDYPGSGPETIVRIPDDWREQSPYSERFPKSQGIDEGRHVIDLAAIRFETDGLVSTSSTGQRVHGMPNLATFAGQLDTSPFLHGNEDYFIVQAKSAADQIALRKWFETTKIPILDYLPQLAYLVRISAAQRRAIDERPEVFWIGHYSPAFRIDSLLDLVIEASPSNQIHLRAIFDSHVHKEPGPLLDRLRELGLADLNIVRRSRDWSLRAEATALRARDLALLPGCLWVERSIPPHTTNNIARSSQNTVTGRGGANGPILDVEDVWARGIRGEGQIASAADTGLSTGTLSTLHQDFGQSGSGPNPLRVVAAFALGRPGNWSDDQSIGGGHGTHVSGSLVGNGFRSGSNPSTNTFPSTSYAGVAPKAHYVFQSMMDAQGGLGGIPADLNTLFQQAYDVGARVHSNSWASTANGAYTTDAQELDQFAWRNKDMVIAVGAGNGGNDSASPGPIDGVINRDVIGSPGTAKNCITVGATENYRPDFVYEFPSGDCTSSNGLEQRTWGWFNPNTFGTAPIFGDAMADQANGLGALSSRGPTDDGRIKPDVVAPGIAVVSTRTDLNQTFEQWGTCAIPAELRPYYVTRGGTSMATPLTAGAATLIRQYYVDGWHPNHSAITHGSPTPPDGFNPSSALVKATLINGAWDMNPGQYGTGATREIVPAWDTGKTLPNNAEGFGRVDVETSLFPGSGWADAAGRRLQVHDVTMGLSTGQSSNFTFLVGGSDDPLIVTLVWTDPQAASGAGTKLVNDLDLTVTDPQGVTTYFPNGVDNTSGKDALNNVEQVKIMSPMSGTWSIRVHAASVPGNAEAGSTAQPFAVVMSGEACAIAPSIPPLVTATTAGPNHIALSWAASSGGPLTYRIYRSGPGASCPTAGYAEIATVSGARTTYDDFTVSGGETYSYKVAAIGSSCESASSECASATATGLCTRPPAFSGLATATSPGNAECSILLTWAPASSICSGAIAYDVYRSTSPSFAPSPANRIASDVATTEYSDVNVSPGVTFSYLVRAVVNGIEETNLVKRSAIPVGLKTTVFGESFDSLPAGSMAGFVISGNGAADWRGVMACSPNQSEANVFRFGGTTCAGSYGNNVNTDAVIGGFAIPANAIVTRLGFWHRWDFESLFDGGTLRLKRLGDSAYTNVPSSAILSGTYNDSAFGQSVWGGTFNTTMTHTIVDLDAACDAIAGNSGGCAGKTIFIAFSAMSDGSVVRPGWFIDDVSVSYRVPCNACTPPGAPGTLTLTASVSNTIHLSWTAGTPPGATYDLYREIGTCPASIPVRIASGIPGTAYTDTGLSGGTTYRYVVRSVAESGCQSVNSSCQSITVTGVPLPPPPGFAATAAGTSVVGLSWKPVEDASTYLIERSLDNTTFTPIAITTGTGVSDPNRSADTVYLYRAFARTASGATSAASRDLATTVAFTDDPIAPGTTPVAAAHVVQLRTAVNAARVLAGLGATSFTDPTITPWSTFLRRAHIAELRARLDETRSALGLAALIYSDPIMTAGITKVKAVHIEELKVGLR